VYPAVYHAVQEALMAGGLVPTAGANISTAAMPDQGAQGAFLTVTARPPVRVGTDFRSGAMDRGARQPDPQSDERWIVRNATETPASAAAETAVEESGPANTTTPGTGRDYRGHDLSSLRVLGQTRNTYIVAQTNDALLLIDQHIAHERVLYEKFVAAAKAGAGIPTQRLMIPMTIDLSRQESIVVEKRLAELAQAGFEMEPFGSDSFLVRSVPASLAQKSLKAQDGPEATLRAIVDEMVEKTVSRKLLLPAEEVLISASCKMAVKAGDPLSFKEMDALIADLLRSQNPYTCPHGRPIILEIPNRDIDRKFGR
jgi:DNA mismatch repair protein MutL